MVLLPGKMRTDYLAQRNQRALAGKRSHRLSGNECSGRGSDTQAPSAEEKGRLRNLRQTMCLSVQLEIPLHLHVVVGCCTCLAKMLLALTKSRVGWRSSAGKSELPTLHDNLQELRENWGQTTHNQRKENCDLANLCGVGERGAACIPRRIYSPIWSV